MYQFALAALSWAGFAAVSLFAVLDFACRLVVLGMLAKMMWRAKDDDGTTTTGGT